MFTSPRDREASSAFVHPGFREGRDLHHVHTPHKYSVRQLRAVFTYVRAGWGKLPNCCPKIASREAHQAVALGQRQCWRATRAVLTTIRGVSPSFVSISTYFLLLSYFMPRSKTGSGSALVRPPGRGTSFQKERLGVAKEQKTAPPPPAAELL